MTIKKKKRGSLKAWLSTRRPVAAEVGRRIRSARVSVGMNQSQVAKKLGVGQSRISGYERGAQLMTIPTLVEIAQVVGVDPEHLIKGLAP